MFVRPSPSYQLKLPDDVAEDIDGRVSSFWLDGNPFLLQLSSYTRTEGLQVPAAQRLTERLTNAGVVWKRLEMKLCRDADQAFGEQPDGEHVWLHCYFVWPHLTIYATVIGPAAQMHASDSWAHNGLRTLRLTT